MRKIELPEPAYTMLGKRSDPWVAKKWGVPTCVVRRERVRLGIETWGRRNWKKVPLELPTTLLVPVLGVSRQCILAARSREGKSGRMFGGSLEQYRVAIRWLLPMLEQQ